MNATDSECTTLFRVYYNRFVGKKTKSKAQSHVQPSVLMLIRTVCMYVHKRREFGSTGGKDLKMTLQHK